MSNNQQPEALRLAHLLALDKWPDAAAELCRQHARIAELDSEATENARIIGASAETELALRGHIAELEAQLSACIKLLKKMPKINQTLYVGNARQSWGVQAKAVLDVISATQAKHGGEA